MNEFERKLSQQPFRAPPAGLREAILGAPSNVVIVARWTWRDWLWPSPRAWAALAAVWTIFVGISLFSGDAARSREMSGGPMPDGRMSQEPSGAVAAVISDNRVSLLSFYQTHRLENAFAYSN